MSRYHRPRIHGVPHRHFFILVLLVLLLVLVSLLGGWAHRLQLAQRI